MAMLVHEAVSLHADMQSHWTDVLVLHGARQDISAVHCALPHKHMF